MQKEIAVTVEVNENDSRFCSKKCPYLKIDRPFSACLPIFYCILTKSDLKRTQKEEALRSDKCIDAENEMIMICNSFSDSPP